MSLRSTSRRVPLFALAILAIASACSGTSTPADSGVDSGPGGQLPNAPLDPLASCQQLAQAQLALEERCLRVAPSDSANFLAAQCPAAIYDLREALFDGGLLAYSAPAVQCALTGLASLDCNADPGISPSCLPLAWGAFQTGQSCDDPFSCVYGQYCQRTSPLSPCGVCSPAAGMSSACGPTGGYAVCLSGLGCVGECEPIVGLGLGCQQDTAVCVQGLSCHPNGCFPPSAIDGGCSDDSDCQDGLTCANEARCITAPTDGGDCSVQNCALGFACASQDAGSICLPSSANGPCVDSDGGPVCPELESCRAGTCVPLSTVGGSCGVSLDCALGACVSGTCTLVAGAGGCARDVECQSQRCDSQVDGSHTCGALCAP